MTSGVSSPGQEDLRVLLSERAILRSEDGQVIRQADGKSAPWMFYSWGATLTEQGSRLAAMAMLRRLSSFQSTRLATFGFTAVPILSACILLGGGRYSGLCIREKRKEYGSLRRVEDPGQGTGPVVILDDSTASGTSILNAIEVLESEGYRVEGSLSLVSFPYGGLERIRSLGYRAEALFDVYQDLGMSLPTYRPIHERLLPRQWGPSTIPDGLHPATAARRVVEAFLKDGVVPRPPEHLDQEYDARGGTFVSFRRRQDEYRVARSGFWHFNPDDAQPCRDLVLATVFTAQQAGSGVSVDALQDLKICVSFFDALEKVPPSRLSFSTHGIVVRSRIMDARMGGALPNTQYFTDEIAQYHHARVRNAKIHAFEPHDIYRHTLTKWVEPGESWLPYGSPHDCSGDWTLQDDIGARLTGRVAELLPALLSLEFPMSGDEPGGSSLCTADASCLEVPGHSVPDDLVPVPLYTVAVTLYHRGVLGCGLSWEGSLDDCLQQATRLALTDSRFVDRATRQGLAVGEIAISVSLLHNPERLGTVAMKDASEKLRRGMDSLAVAQGPRRAILLGMVATWYNWSKSDVGRQALKKAGIEGGACEWTTYQTASWLKNGKYQGRLEFGFPARGGTGYEGWEDDARLLAGYLERHLESDGLPTYLYLPVKNARTGGGSLPRRIHALVALNLAGRLLGEEKWCRASLDGLRFCVDHLKTEGNLATLALPHIESHATADSHLLMALAESTCAELRGEGYEHLAVRVRALVQADGRVTERPDGRGVQTDHDFLPGTVLLAVARYVEAGGERAFLDGLDAALEWNRRRFSLARPWGMVGWQTQAWSAIHCGTGRSDQAAFVFELADWALDRQHEASGGFITEMHSHGYSFHSAFIAEGIADAWRVALRAGDISRAGRYEHSCRNAMRLLSRLMIRSEDTFCMPDPDQALGGVRGSLASSDVRIDHVSHTLLALLKSMANLGLTR